MHVTTSTGTHKLVVFGYIAALATSVAAIILVPATIGRALSSSSFLPHAYCYLYDKKLIALNLGSDGMIWLSYVSIALTLVYLVRSTRQEMPFSWMFLAFGTFIIACGFTHFMEMVVLWKPLYWLAGDLKLITALASVVTAIALPPLIPQIQSLIRSANVSEERGIRLEQVNQELHSLSAHVLSAQDGERRRIARELHDGVGQYLAAIKMSCDVALSEDEDAETTRESLSDCRNLVERCSKEIRTMSYLLHPPLLEEMGLVAAVRWYIEGFTERSGIEVELEMPEKFDRLPQSVEMVIFRVLQESLTNVHRHSGSAQAKVNFTVDAERAILLVQDYGKGFGGLGEPKKIGVGIAGMRERVRELGGEFNIDSNPKGISIRAALPLQRRS